MTPDNATFFYAAYVAGLVVYAGYVLLLRWRERDLAAREDAATRLRPRAHADDAFSRSGQPEAGA